MGHSKPPAVRLNIIPMTCCPCIQVLVCICLLVCLFVRFVLKERWLACQVQLRKMHNATDDSRLGSPKLVCNQLLFSFPVALSPSFPFSWLMFNALPWIPKSLTSRWPSSGSFPWQLEWLSNGRLSFVNDINDHALSEKNSSLHCISSSQWTLSCL